MFRRIVEVAEHGLQALRAFPGEFSGNGFVGGNAESKQVHAVVGSLTFDQFGSHVVGGTSAVAWSKEFRPIGYGQTEINQFDHALMRHQDIAWADVAVQVALTVNVSQAFGCLHKDLNSLAPQSRAIGFDEVIQSRPFDQLHHEERFALGGHAVLVSGNDVAMAEAQTNGSFAGFVQPYEALLEAFGFFLVEDFEADGSAELAVVGPENARHTPLAQPPLQNEAVLNPHRFLLVFRGAEKSENLVEDAHGWTAGLIPPLLFLWSPGRLTPAAFAIAGDPTPSLRESHTGPMAAIICHNSQSDGPVRYANPCGGRCGQ